MTHACTYRFLDADVKLPSPKAVAFSALIAVSEFVAFTLLGLPAYIAWHFAAATVGAALLTSSGLADVKSTPRATITSGLGFGAVISLAYWLFS